MSTIHTAIIAGAGVSGIAVAYYLKKDNLPFIILEAASSEGGTWRDQRWHGARVDTEVVEYCFSFKVEIPDKVLWSRRRVNRYLHDVTRQFGIFEHIKFNERVIKASFDSSKNLWNVMTESGNTYVAPFLFNCNGFGGTTPHIPQFNGIYNFKGKVIHTVSLDDKLRFDDKHVVIVGSGATAISSAPDLSEVSKSLTIVQRSPSYIYEMDTEPDRIWRAFRRLQSIGVKNTGPALQLIRMIHSDIVFTLVRKFPSLARSFFRRHWTKYIDAEFVDTHMNPRYNPLEQRICVSVGLRERIASGKIRFKSGDISHFTGGAIVMKTGDNVPCDVCILATGFDFNLLSFNLERDGNKVTLDYANFYKTFMMGGLPNYFQPVGCFDCSWTQRIESIAAFTVKIIKYMEQNSFANVEVPRKFVPNDHFFQPNYILRNKKNPRAYGLWNIPTMDYFFSFHLATCRELVFSK